MGKQHDGFNVHEKLIRTSPFFDKAISGRWRESTQKTVQLPEDEPEIFGIYVHWLYFGKLSVFRDDLKSKEQKQYRALVKAYSLGDKFMNTKFQNTVIDAIVEESVSPASDGKHYYPNGLDIEYAYNNTNTLSPLRRLLVDMYAFSGNGSWLRDHYTKANYPQLFIFDLACTLLDQQSRVATKSTDYHIEASAGKTKKKS